MCIFCSSISVRHGAYYIESHRRQDAAVPVFVAPIRLPLGKQPPPLKAAAGRPHLLTPLHPRFGSLYCRQFIFCEVLHKPIAILFFYAIIQYIQQRQHPALWRYHMIILGFIHFSSTSFLRLQSYFPFFIIVLYLSRIMHIYTYSSECKLHTFSVASDEATFALPSQAPSLLFIGNL